MLRVGAALNGISNVVFFIHPLSQQTFILGNMKHFQVEDQKNAVKFVLIKGRKKLKTYYKTRHESLMVSINIFIN